MFYFLVLQLLTKLKYNNIKLLFWIGTIIYLVSIHLYKHPIYSLLIPIDISYTAYNHYKDRDLPFRSDKVSSHIIKESTLNKTIIGDINITKKPLDMTNISQVNTGMNVNTVIMRKKNKIKYIPHKLDIKSPLQQTVRNLGI